MDWFYRYKVAGKTRRKGLGSYPKVSLERAREKARQCELWRDQGLDPIDYERQLKQDQKVQQAKDHAKSKTFRVCAADYIASKKNEWSNAKHAKQWTQTLEDYAYPAFGDIPVADIDASLVVEALKPIWIKKTETANRVRQRVEVILNYAESLHYREGKNPARWRGHLDNILPKPSKIQKVVHHAAMPYKQVPEYFRRLRGKETIAALALSLAILTATRSGEARGARWSEIDLGKKLWVIPAERMKARREFRIPLSDTAVAVLMTAERFKIEDQDWVFPGLSGKNCVTEAAIRKLLKDTGATMHGFRSSFRDWVAEMTNYPRELGEAALAHALDNKTEAAYQRGDKLDKRRRMMGAWDKYLLTYKNSKASTVVDIKTKQG